MLSCHQFYDVVVIDEIQMIGDTFRGDAWTQAILGVQAKEVHLCGEESVVGLIERIAHSCQDQFFLHRYQRLTPLKVADSSLHGDLSKVQRGDCLVTFSRNNIYALKKAIQSATNLRVGMAYGGLPPEVREREAQMFNRGGEVKGEGGYDVLVGSDAIGMGLNLYMTVPFFFSCSFIIRENMAHMLVLP
jgi:ATP-dependent RNA helicase SUPV3L1/SUV3